MADTQIGPGRGRPADISARDRTSYVYRLPSKPDMDLRKQAEGRLIGLRVNRYSWWVHWRECADYMLPRRYKWIITPNQMSRGSPINQHILDSTASLAARNLAAGMMTGCTDPTKRWFRLRIGREDSTMTSPTSLWLSECERILNLIFQESNFYPAMGVLYFDLVIFGTGVMIMYEDYDNVIRCFNPCLGEYYLDNDQSFWPAVMYREFTLTIDQCVREFGIDAVSPAVARLYKEGGPSLTRELVVAHGIEPNDDGRKFGIPEHFKYREVYWEWMGTASPQGGASSPPGILRKRGFHEQPYLAVRWDLVSNDPYGRSPGMDALPDTKQLQLETKRKAQGIDKQVNPPMLADIQLKNQPASLLPGGITYISGMVSQGRTGFAPAYQVNPNLADMKEDLVEIRERIKETFYNNLFQTISQYETRSNVTAAEIDARRSESMVMLGPVLERLCFEGLKPAVERTFAIASRAGIFPPAPREIRGKNIEIDFVSMLELAQDAAQMAGIERIMQMVGQLEGVRPEAIDVVDTDYGIMKASHLLNNDPKLIRSPAMLAQMRQQRAQQAQQAQMAASADAAQKLSAGAKNLSDVDVGGGQNAVQAMIGGLGG
jgi:hypothetical protein